ncbi:hypothetical protein DFH06DRAFT_67404 [Mycena polygramma]|nr:hypothetical protein DFH06DRAFT_67404 [Mycena polygramma]
MAKGGKRRYWGQNKTKNVNAMIVPVEGVVFVCEDPDKTFVIKKKTKNKETVDVSRELFEDDQLRKSTKDVSLIFQDSNISIIYSGSSGRIWVKSKDGVLTKDMPHRLKDGDKITFGATDGPGRKKNPAAVRVKVKFLTTGSGLESQSMHFVATDAELPPYSPRRSLGKCLDDSELEQQETKASNSHSKASQKAVPPSPIALHRCASAINLGEAEPEHTDLAYQVRIPWSKDFHVGNGINALTGEYMATTAFRDDFKPRGWTTDTSATQTNHFEWQVEKDLHHDFEVATTVNIPHVPGGLNAGITEQLSKASSASTIFVQHKHEVHLVPNSIPQIPSLLEGAENLTPEDFRNTYGDYYIAGYEKGYSCSMIFVCKTEEATVTEKHRAEAKAIVERYLGINIETSDNETQTASVSMLSVIANTTGCLGDLSNKLIKIEDALQKVSELEGPSQNGGEAGSLGVPRTAILKHYTTHPSLHHLPRRVKIPLHNFQRAGSMRKTYAHLRDYCCPHPALKKYPDDRRIINKVLLRFVDLQKSLVKAAPGSKEEKAVKSLEKDLENQTQRAETIIERYHFIRNIVDMDKDVRSGPPDYGNNNGAPYYSWECGKTGTAVEHPESDPFPFLDKYFGEAHKIFQYQWTATARRESFFSRLGSAFSAPQDITFRTRETKHLPLPPHGIPARQSKWSETLPNQKPVYIVGWSMGCYNATPPSVSANHPSNHILSDHLTLQVRKAAPVNWNCTVFYVEQSEYNFPELAKLAGKSVQGPARK